MWQTQPHCLFLLQNQKNKGKENAINGKNDDGYVFAIQHVAHSKAIYVCRSWYWD